MARTLAFRIRSLLVIAFLMSLLGGSPFVMAYTSPAPAADTHNTMGNHMAERGATQSGPMGSGMNNTDNMGPQAMRGKQMGPGMMNSMMRRSGMMGRGPMRWCRSNMMASHGDGSEGSGPLHNGEENLSPKQRSRIADVCERMQEQMRPIMDDLRQQRLALSQLLNAENPDRPAIFKVYDRITALQKKLIELRLQVQQQFKNILTPEQRKQLH